jgi:hypothetical protein
MAVGIPAQGRDRIIFEQDVIVGNQDISSPADLETLVAGVSEPEVFVVEDGSHPLIVGGENGNRVATPVGRTVVHEDELEVDPGGVDEDRLDALDEDLVAIPIR